MRVFDASEKHPIFGLTIMVTGGRTLLVADTHVNMMPTAQELAAIARRSVIAARRMGHEPRVAFLSSSNFGNPDVPETKRVRDAVRILDGEETDFEYDGEMKVDTALDAALMRDLFPFCRLSDVANVLIMPDLGRRQYRIWSVASSRRWDDIRPAADWFLSPGTDRAARCLGHRPIESCRHRGLRKPIGHSGQEIGKSAVDIEKW